MIELSELGNTIDSLYRIREERLSIEKRVKELKSNEMDLRNQILEALEASGLRKASGDVATCGIKVSTIPLVTDWDQVFSYIKDHDRFDLVQKRISVLAWRSTYEEGEMIPGTEAVEDVDVSLTKASRA